MRQTRTSRRTTRSITTTSPKTTTTTTTKTKTTTQNTRVFCSTRNTTTTPHYYVLGIFYVFMIGGVPVTLVIALTSPIRHIQTTRTVAISRNTFLTSFSSNTFSKFPTSTKTRKLNPSSSTLCFSSMTNNNPSPGDNTTTTTTTTMTTMRKPRILCLHGKNQNGFILSNKIAGARRKLARVYQLDFLDGPVVLPIENNNDDDDDDDEQQQQQQQQQQLAWWIRNETTQKHEYVAEGLQYVMTEIQKAEQEGWPYSALLGFSQGGLLATTLVAAGLAPSSIKAVVTAGSPYYDEVFEAADEYYQKLHGSEQQQQQQREQTNDDDDDDVTTEAGSAGAEASATNTTAVPSTIEVPMLHFAGENDTIIPVLRVQTLCERGGSNGQVICHEKGHMFPTKAVYTNAMMEFLEKHILI